MSDTQEKLEAIQATKTKSNKTRSGYEITLDPEYLTELIESAKREGAIDKASELARQNLLYASIYGELPLEYKGVDLLEAYKSFRQQDNFRKNFARYVEQVSAQLKQS